MRTYKWMAAIVLLLGMTSCGTYYRMVSQVYSDGNMHREVYAYGDSAFLAGDRNHNPFLFRIDSGWEVSNLDSAVKFNCWGDEDKLNVKAGKLSFGQQQRVAFIRAFCQPFDFLFLDEPISHLDDENSRIMGEIIIDEAGKQSAGVIATSIGKHIELPYKQVLQL